MRGLVIIVLVVVLAHAAHAGFERHLPDRAVHGAAVTNTFELTDVAYGQEVVIGEYLPDETMLVDWEVRGARESRGDIYFHENASTLVWSFTAARPNPEISYDIILPVEGEIARFEAIYVLSENRFGVNTHDILLREVEGAPAMPMLEQASPFPYERADMDFPYLYFSMLVSIFLALLAYVHYRSASMLSV